MKEDLESYKGQQFNNYIPYIQLHEFEALVFSSTIGFESLFENNEMKFKGICEVIDGFTNPEDINDSPETAPSKRMQKLIPGYNKVAYGISLIEYTGIDTILKKCPHFRKWIEKLKDAIEQFLSKFFTGQDLAEKPINAIMRKNERKYY